jgi:hypothetical protein
MKYLIISVFVFLIFNPAVFAQSDKEDIEIQKVFGGYKYTQNGIDLNMKRLVNTMRYDELASKKMKSARFNNTLATVFGATGGFLIVWPIVTAITNGDPNWTLAYIGAGLIVISIPLSIAGNKQAARAINIYNTNRRNQSFQSNSTKLRFNITGIGLGLTLEF